MLLTDSARRLAAVHQLNLLRIHVTTLLNDVSQAFAKNRFLALQFEGRSSADLCLMNGSV